MKTVYTFDLFWEKYHHVNPQYKLNKNQARILWDNCNCEGKKKAIIQGIEKSKLNALNYLKTKL